MSDERAEYQQLPLDLLDFSPDNVRQEGVNEDIDELARSLDEIGLQQPIVVQQQGDRYEVLIGQRRLLAARRLGWPGIDAKILPGTLDSIEAKIRSFAENAQRRDISPRDKAEACAFLLDQLGSIAKVAQRIGVSEVTVRKWIGYAAVPEDLKQMVDAGKISRPMATRLATAIEDPAKAVTIAEEMDRRRLTRPERDRVVSVAEEDPDVPVTVLFDKSEEARTPREISFILPGKWARAIDRASVELEREVDDIAKEATIEWLNRYIETGYEA